MPFAELGYDSKQRCMPQINLLYISSLDENRGAPVYYKQFIGSTPDVSAFADVLTGSTLRHPDCTIIADKGFVSESDFWTARFQKPQICHSSSPRQQIR